MHSRSRYVIGSIIVAALAAFAFAQHEKQEHAKHEENSADKASEKQGRGDAYPFAACPISGKKLGAMGDPVVKTVDGREVAFCCSACVDKFDKEASSKLDAKVIADQGPLYPLTTSVVTGKALPDKPFDFVFGYRLVRLGGEAEKSDFLKDAKKYIADLDKAVIAKQEASYPLDVCPVSKEKLDSKAVSVVRAGRLFKLCCSDCKSGLDKQLAADIAMLDEARAKSKK